MAFCVISHQLKKVFEVVFERGYSSGATVVVWVLVN